jgi:serine/threonine-protein kinase
MEGAQAQRPFRPGVGDRLGRYRLEALLGEGAVGVVFRAAREPDELTVALKILRRTLSESEVFTARFLREARVARELEHRNLVSVLDAGEVDGRYYLAMQHVPGRSLEDRLERDGPLPIEDALRIVADVAAGLDALHGRGLLHRDVKPSNVMLDREGTAMLTDFGLAKGPAYTVLTKPGEVVGTLDYLAPELFRGEGASPASDLYALGCVAYACLTGAPPFASESILQIAVAHLGKDPAEPRSLRPDLPESLSRAVLQAIAKDPGARPKTARAYALALLRAASA